MNKTQGVILLAMLFGILLVFPSHANAETLGSIAVTLKYTNGDTVDYYPISLKIYQDFDNTPLKYIETLSGNPFNIVSLPVDHKYKIVAYANSLQAGVAYVDLQQPHQDVTMNLPLSGGMRINAFYNDKTTPISNATVFIRSPDNKTWSHGPINSDGLSMRFWMSPTISSGDYYITDIRIGSHLVYSQSPTYLQAGIPQEVKVVTNWPPTINNLIIVKLHNVQGTHNKFTVDMFDSSNHKVTESILDSRGEAYFSNMIVGDYSFVATNSSSNTNWGRLNVTIDGSKSTFEIFETQKTSTQSKQSRQQNQPIVQTHASATTISHEITKCNCVAFRLDNVQDYWLDAVQSKIIDIFYQKNLELTIGVIGNAFGNDIKLVNQTKTEKEKIDVAVNGWNFEDFTTLDEHGQEVLLGQATNKISSILGITPIVFIPPYGKANNDTFFAMSNIGIHYLSPTTDMPSPNPIIHTLPAKISDEFFINQANSNNDLLANIKSAINNDGFTIVTINFQDFAENNNAEKINVPDMTKVEKLTDLIDDLQNNGIKVVGIKNIITKSSLTPMIPSWIKNNAKWWSDGTISDDEFIKGIQYLVQNGMIVVSHTQPNVNMVHAVPSWIKNNAKWWSDGTISDDEFIKGIQYLVQNGMIKA